ncbi:hypothetical protein SDC9_57967 [bioreactor metagenome]|uniref:TonB-dependent receptor plug domain-containing protein n=1 Tax=bioreactor metagenome TaxID=1076179 RepID=A0A644X6B0_9ZZZZ
MKKIALFLFISALTVASFAQKGTIRGFVYDKGNSEPVIFTNVYLKGTTYGSPTDINGYFTISQIPPGTYELMITYLGYDTLRETITIKAGELISKKYYLEKGARTINTVDIYGSSGDDTTQTLISKETVTPIEIKQVPMFGSPDIVQYITNIPGIISTGDQGGQLYIRGGSSIQNKVLLDGMVVYNPFHSIGLFSVFETEIIRNVDVYTGGFGAEYGGRISSVMDITTRDGNKKNYSGVFMANPFGANLVFEGPIVKDKGKGFNSSFILAAKNSYLSESSKIFYNYIDTAGLPFDFRDIYGKVSLATDNGTKINFFGFNFTDDVTYRSIANFAWDASGGGTNFVIVPGASPMLIDGIFSYSDYNITLTDQTNLPKTSSIKGFNASLGFTYFPGKNSDLKYGLELQGFNTDLTFYNTARRLISQQDNTTEVALYVKYKTIIDSVFIIEPSFRLQAYPSLSEISPEPRLAMKYNVTPKFRVKAAGGLYTQNLISASSDRDVVNLFYGFISGPENLQEDFDGKDVTSRLQKAQHAIFGFEFGPFKLSKDNLRPRTLTFNLELYYKNFSQLTNINRNKVYDDTGEYYDKPDYLKKDFIVENGDAEGIDLSVKYNSKKLYLWGVYSYGFVHRYDGLIHYAPHYDRRHNANLVASYRFGEHSKWEVSFRWNLGSGFPFTQNAGFYPSINFTDGLDTDIFTSEEELGVLYDEYNKGRLPYYHRLDFSAKRTFYLSETVKLEANFAITNLYNRANVFYFDRITNERVDQLPMMPSLGLSLRF